MLKNIFLSFTATGSTILRHMPDLKLPMAPEEVSLGQMVQEFNEFNARLRQLLIALRTLLEDGETDAVHRLCVFDWALSKGIQVRCGPETLSFTLAQRKQASAMMLLLEKHRTPPSREVDLSDELLHPAFLTRFDVFRALAREKGLDFSLNYLAGTNRWRLVIHGGENQPDYGYNATTAYLATVLQQAHHYLLSITPASAKTPTNYTPESKP